MSKLQNDLVAKLLANEDITVLREAVPTASFDIKSRILRLPRWEGFSDSVEQMLIAHEISHALFTNEKYLTLIEEVVNFPGGSAYMNILEDARIEKLIKRKYPGLRKVFRYGYDELKEKKFFGTNTEVAAFDHLIDRINLYFKLGFDSVKFSQDEMVFVRRAEALETLEDVAELAVDIYNFLKTNSKPNSSFDQVEGEGDCDENEIDSKNNSSNSAAADDLDTTPKSSSKTLYAEESDGTEPDEPISNDILEKNLRNTINSSLKISYVTIGKYPKNILVPYTQVLSYLKTAAPAGLVSSVFDKLVDMTKNNVAYMVKEFEMKKAAAEFKRAQISKSGILDTKKLYSYKVNDDLFKRVTIRKTGKNHGMVMLLDWSGSMNGVIQNTIDQLINLVMFCQRVNIPFEVYIFGASNTRTIFQQNSRNNNEYLNVPNTIPVNPSDLLVEIFNSKMSAQEFKMMGSLLKNGTFLRYIPLGNTPLNSALAVMYNYLGVFRDKHKVEKLTFITLTDGESQPLPKYNLDNKTPLRIGDRLKIFAIEERTKKPFEVTNHMVNVTVQLHAMIKERYKCASITFHIIEDSGSYRITRAMESNAPMVNGKSTIASGFELVMKRSIDRHKFSIFNDGVRDSVLIIPRHNIKINEDNQSMDSVTQKTTARGIAAAFTKSQQSKKQSRILLNSFIDSIA